MYKKYELLENDTILKGKTILYRIKALRNFNDVHKGDLGGYIESENNLSQFNDCWIYNASCQVFGNALICDNAKIQDGAKISGQATIGGNAIIKGLACIFGDTFILGNTVADGIVRISGETIIRGNTHIGKFTRLTDTVTLKDAVIQDYYDCLCLSGIRKSFFPIAFYRTKKGINVYEGGVTFTLPEFQQRVSTNSTQEYTLEECNLMLDLVKLHFNLFSSKD